MVGGAKSGSCEKIQEKGGFILAGDASDSVLRKCGSYVQNEISSFEVLGEKCVWIRVLTSLPRIPITKERCTYLCVSKKNHKQSRAVGIALLIVGARQDK